MARNWWAILSFFEFKIILYSGSQIGNYYVTLQPVIEMERIFSKGTLREFWSKHPVSEQYLKTWFDTALNSGWRTPNEVKLTYASASILKNGRIVFNIKGNTYRMVVKVNYEKQWLFIRFIGTHEEYNHIDAENI